MCPFRVNSIAPANHTFEVSIGAALTISNETIGRPYLSALFSTACRL